MINLISFLKSNTIINVLTDLHIMWLSNDTILKLSLQPKYAVSKQEKLEANITALLERYNIVSLWFQSHTDVNKVVGIYSSKKVATYNI